MLRGLLFRFKECGCEVWIIYSNDCSLLTRIDLMLRLIYRSVSQLYDKKRKRKRRERKKERKVVGAGRFRGGVGQVSLRLDVFDMLD